MQITRRDHSIIACSRHIHMGVVLRVHPVRGESCIQRNANREVAIKAIQRGDFINDMLKSVWSVVKVTQISGALS